MLQRFFILWVLVFWTLPSSAQWSDRAAAGLGFTDNANLTSTDRVSDFFLLARTSDNYKFTNGDELGLFLSYRGYSHETQNNVWNFRVGDVISKSFSQLGKWDFDIGVGGQKYSSTSPGTTEENFDSYYVEAIADHIKPISSKTDLLLEPGLQYKIFPDFGGRGDFMLFCRIALGWHVNPKLDIRPFFEIDLVDSNQELYTRTVLAAGSDFIGYLDPTLKWDFGFLSKSSTYPYRDISAPTLITTRRGLALQGSQTEKEVITYFQLQGGLVKMVGAWNFRTSIANNSQSSLSATEDYSEWQITEVATYLF